jgi:hypothetical protein
MSPAISVVPPAIQPVASGAGTNLEKKASEALEVFAVSVPDLMVSSCFGGQNILCTKENLKAYKEASDAIGQAISKVWIEVLSLVQTKRGIDGALQSADRRLKALVRQLNPSKNCRKPKKKSRGKCGSIWDQINRDPYALPDLFTVREDLFALASLPTIDSTEWEEEFTDLPTFEDWMTI